MFQDTESFYTFEFLEYFRSLNDNLFNLIIGILDIAIVLFLIYKSVKILRKTRAWQLFKGIAILIVLTFISGWLKFKILNAILMTLMTYRSIYTNCCISTRA